MGEQEVLTTDPLFVGLTRPAMKWGVPYIAVLGNLVLTMELFLLSRNLLVLLVGLPIHGVCVLLTARDARVFELALLWMRTTGQARWCQGRIGSVASYGVLAPAGVPSRGPVVRVQSCVA